MGEMTAEGDSTLLSALLFSVNTYNAPCRAMRGKIEGLNTTSFASFFSILCEILSVSSEVLEFRRRVAASFPSPSRRRIFVGELAQPPQYPAPISPDKVEPKELPPRPNSERQQNQQHSRQQRDHLEHQQPHHQETTSKAEDSDSLSTVSTGSIGRIGAINSNNSDNVS